jgi:hypothetical protein
MITLDLEDYQLQAIDKLKTGSILCGGVGSGKSRTALAYYVLHVGKGQLSINNFGMFRPMSIKKNLVIITTAKKRDEGDWLDECIPFYLSDHTVLKNPHGVDVYVDSWNNIAKYQTMKNSFFIFDEQRVVGAGSWVKSFLKITKVNDWILLSATPGDTWHDYIPVFIANKFVKNRQEFYNEYCVFARYVDFPKIERYLHEKRLLGWTKQLLVTMDRTNVKPRTFITAKATYNHEKYRTIVEARWNPYTNKPIENINELCLSARHVINEDTSRLEVLYKYYQSHGKVIVFYNYNYELEILRNFANEYAIPHSEWNGHNHDPIPNTHVWLYLVQYTAGAEGWNCITTDIIVFFSLNYSYKIMEQACGRIDRMNSPFKEMNYVYIVTEGTIDDKILESVNNKKKFNERQYYNKNINSQ